MKNNDLNCKLSKEPTTGEIAKETLKGLCEDVFDSPFVALFTLPALILYVIPYVTHETSKIKTSKSAEGMSGSEAFGCIAGFATGCTALYYQCKFYYNNLEYLAIPIATNVASAAHVKWGETKKELRKRRGLK